MKKEQFDRMQEEIEEEKKKKKLVAIAAEKEQAYEKNSTARVVEKAIKQIEELGEQLERDFEEYTTHPSSYYQRSRKQQQSASSRTVANLSLEDMMRKNE